MSAGRVAVERRARCHGTDTGTAASAGDSTGRADAGPTVTVRVPLSFGRRRGRKVLVAPEGGGQEALRAPRAPTHTRDEVTPAVRALARAFRWRKLLESGAVATVHEIAEAEKINPSYVSRVLRMTLLSPEVVEAVGAGIDKGGAAALNTLMMQFPIDWSRQPSLGN